MHYNWRPYLFISSSSQWDRFFLDFPFSLLPSGSHSVAGLGIPDFFHSFDPYKSFCSITSTTFSPLSLNADYIIPDSFHRGSPSPSLPTLLTYLWCWFESISNQDSNVSISNIVNVIVINSVRIVLVNITETLRDRYKCKSKLCLMLGLTNVYIISLSAVVSGAPMGSRRAEIEQLYYRTNHQSIWL